MSSAIKPITGKKVDRQSTKRGKTGSVNMLAKGDKLSKTKGGMAKSTSQPSKKDCKY